MIGNKIADKITKISKTSQQNNSETITNELDKKYVKKDTYISRRKTENYWWSKINSGITMEDQKIINLLDNAPNQPTKFK